MPDGFNFWPVIQPPPGPATVIWPGRARAEVLVDCWGVCLADPQNSIIGLPGPLPSAVARIAYAERTEGTRNL